MVRAIRNLIAAAHAAPHAAARAVAQYRANGLRSSLQAHRRTCRLRTERLAYSENAVLYC
jgi:hypothetical protein